MAAGLQLPAAAHADKRNIFPPNLPLAPLSFKYPAPGLQKGTCKSQTPCSAPHQHSCGHPATPGCVWGCVCVEITPSVPLGAHRELPENPAACSLLQFGPTFSFLWRKKGERCQAA